METLVHSLTEQIVNWVPQIISAALVFLAFWVAAKGVVKLINRVSKQTNIDSHVISLLAQAANITIVIFGIVTALGTLGVNVSALVAGLGLTGFALGFATKDTISNILAGVLILIYHPFKLHDSIKVSSYEGKVIAIDLRYTTLENQESLVLIPNSKLFTDPITILK